MSNLDTFATILSQLDQWRHFPDYQLERRTDIYFGIYLRDFLQVHVGTPLQRIVIPEFPIKRDLIWPDLPTHKSVKVDYSLFSEDRSKVFFVELKTTIASRRPKQDEYLATASRVGFPVILEGLLKIINRTTSHRKYFHLLAALSAAGFLRIPPGLGKAVFAPARSRFKHLYKEIQILPGTSTIQVFYLQPVVEVPSERHIDFEGFATFLDSRQDDFASQFATYLRKWTVEVGTIPPERSE
jgi:hypothetical protein